MGGLVAQATFRRASWCICLMIAAAVDAGGAPGENEALQYLDTRNPTLTQPIRGEKPGSTGAKFVQVEVAEVINPDKVPVTFEVGYQERADRRIRLGSFSLYPADNPGRFIVATQGKIKDEGAVVLSLVIPDTAPSRDKIRVGVKRMTFLGG
jgi:hypothetical protein